MYILIKDFVTLSHSKFWWHYYITNQEISEDIGWAANKVFSLLLELKLIMDDSSKVQGGRSHLPKREWNYRKIRLGLCKRSGKNQLANLCNSMNQSSRVVNQLPPAHHPLEVRVMTNAWKRRGGTHFGG